jgi:hypothetical protein
MTPNGALLTLGFDKMLECLTREQLDAVVESLQAIIAANEAEKAVTPNADSLKSG